MTVPLAAAWTGVPLGTPMSIPGWSVPQRIPNGLVIGPETGQANPELGAGGSLEVPDEPACSDCEIFAASCALAAASASDSLISSCTCCFVVTSACDLPARALARWLRLES